MIFAGPVKNKITGPAARSSRPTSSTRDNSMGDQNEDVSLRALDGTPSARVTRNLAYILASNFERSVI